MAEGWVTVALPIRNGERYLDEVLRGVRAQKVDRDLELLIVDSGSTDRTIEIAASHEATVHRIPRGSFSHGATRNLIMELARGEHVAFLTDDATPAHDGWLQAMLDSFEVADDVALAWGPQLPRPNASLAIRSELKRWFANWDTPDGSIHIQRLDPSAEGMAAYRAEMWRWQFFSDVNSCVARWAWERIPFRPVPISEDQVIGREMIEAGYAKAFNPHAAVLHSHDFPPAEFFRRYFEEWRGLRETLGVVHPGGVRHGWEELRSLMREDRNWLRDVEGVRGAHAVLELGRSLRHHSSRVIGSALGTRADKLPSHVRGALSIESRDTFVPYTSDESGRLERPPERDWAYSFIKQAHPRRTVHVEADPRAHQRQSLTIAVGVDPWRIGSTRHATVFNLLRALEERGHRCSVRLFDPAQREPRSGRELEREIEQWFTRCEIPVERGFGAWAGADVALATHWTTLYAMRDLSSCAEKAYLAQCFEPDFMPVSAVRLWAEDALRMGYRSLAANPVLERRLRDKYGMETVTFDPGTDLLTYRPARDDARERKTIAVYAGDDGGRTRELAAAALGILKERRPSLRVIAFGAHDGFDAAFALQDLGDVQPARLLALYQQATAGLSLSLAAESPATRPMMASRLPVLELGEKLARTVFGESGELVAQATPEPVALAEGLERLLDDGDARTGMADRALAWVEKRTWTAAAAQVEQALRGFLATHR